MTVSQAAALRLMWMQHVNRQLCEHIDLALERSEAGYLTGRYNCTVCGDHVVPPQK